MCVQPSIRQAVRDDKDVLHPDVSSAFFKEYASTLIQSDAATEAVYADSDGEGEGDASVDADEDVGVEAAAAAAVSDVGSDGDAGKGKAGKDVDLDAIEELLAEDASDAKALAEKAFAHKKDKKKK